jgi:hypothetical protein
MHQDDETPSGWLVLIYRVPPEPSSNRVSIWRDLKRMGALYLQQCVCVVPRRAELLAAVTEVREKVGRLGGSSNLFEVMEVAAEEAGSLIGGFQDLAAKQYAEIIEECETKFVKEIEFERFRQNFSFAEAEEIEQDLEKIRRWFAQVQQRDWYNAPGRDEVAAWITRCAELLDGFYDEVHARAAAQPSSPDAAEMEREVPRLAGIPQSTAQRASGAQKVRRRRAGA